MDTPKIDWVKNDPKQHRYFIDGSKFLVALQVSNNKTGVTKWEFDTVMADCDGESMGLRCPCNGDTYDAWLWEDFEFFALLGGEMPTAEPTEEL
jgi:hypothetical protein